MIRAIVGPAREATKSRRRNASARRMAQRPPLKLASGTNLTFGTLGLAQNPAETSEWRVIIRMILSTSTEAE
jgi:hypothetical protein